MRSTNFARFLNSFAIGWNIRHKNSLFIVRRKMLLFARTWEAKYQSFTLGLWHFHYFVWLYHCYYLFNRFERNPTTDGGPFVSKRNRSWFRIIFIPKIIIYFISIFKEYISWEIKRLGTDDVCRRLVPQADEFRDSPQTLMKKLPRESALPLTLLRAQPSA